MVTGSTLPHSARSIADQQPGSAAAELDVTARGRLDTAVTSAFVEFVSTGQGVRSGPYS
ncbi:hypothetical protein [Nocardia vaccinii]|uniref:hypothetical protein n=1 Tax=Nocardia vaccinii TaxID=1822 RepID=UPI000B0B5DD9|nr:hypothetical protein [Nocardia vaccinii]